MKTPARPKRFVVHTRLQSGVGRTIREPHDVIDTTTNTPIDSYSTKRAATMHAAYANKHERTTEK